MLVTMVGGRVFDQFENGLAVSLAIQFGRPAGRLAGNCWSRWRDLDWADSIQAAGARSPCDGRNQMATVSQTVRRTVQFKFTLPAGSSTHLTSLLRAAAPFYEAFGGRRVRLLQNVDDPARFMHEIEYETHEVIELNRQRVASDPRVQAYLQTWRTLLPGSIEIDVYQEVG